MNDRERYEKFAPAKRRLKWQFKVLLASIGVVLAVVVIVLLLSFAGGTTVKKSASSETGGISQESAEAGTSEPISEEPSSEPDSSAGQSNQKASSKGSNAAKSSAAASSKKSAASFTGNVESVLPDSGLTPEWAAKELDMWYLYYVDFDNRMPENYVPPVVKINTPYTRDKSFQFDSRCVDQLRRLLNDANNSGVDLFVYSPYRSYEHQKAIYNNRVNEIKKKGKSQAEAEIEAAQRIMPPGCSEHNLGLSLDFNIASDSFTGTKPCKWLMEHAADYGFVMSYPQDKVSITKVDYESWHYRYVGVDHAKRMKAKNMCLSEYRKFLTDIKNGN